jgi:hypothetical protein
MLHALACLCCFCLYVRAPGAQGLVVSVHAGADISPWHDIPLQGKDGTYNFVCEIPKETSAKMEVATVSSPRSIEGFEPARATSTLQAPPGSWVCLDCLAQRQR